MDSDFLRCVEVRQNDDQSSSLWTKSKVESGRLIGVLDKKAINDANALLLLSLIRPIPNASKDCVNVMVRFIQHKVCIQTSREIDENERLIADRTISMDDYWREHPRQDESTAHCSQQHQQQHSYSHHHHQQQPQPHQCPLCPKSFSSASGLKQHSHIHCSSKPFRCHICNKAYTQFSNLCRHRRIHLDGWQCGYCNASFPSHSALIKHRTTCEAQMTALSAFYKPVAAQQSLLTVPAHYWPQLLQLASSSEQQNNHQQLNSLNAAAISLSNNFNHHPFSATSSLLSNSDFIYRYVTGGASDGESSPRSSGHVSELSPSERKLISPVESNGLGLGGEDDDGSCSMEELELSPLDLSMKTKEEIIVDDDLDVDEGVGGAMDENDSLSHQDANVNDNDNGSTEEVMNEKSAADNDRQTEVEVQVEVEEDGEDDEHADDTDDVDDILDEDDDEHQIQITTSKMNACRNDRNRSRSTSETAISSATSAAATVNSDVRSSALITSTENEFSSGRLGVLNCGGHSHNHPNKVALTPSINPFSSNAFMQMLRRPFSYPAAILQTAAAAAHLAPFQASQAPTITTTHQQPPSSHHHIHQQTTTSLHNNHQHQITNNHNHHVTTNASANNLQLSKNNRDRYTCKFCAKVFPRSANLTRHLRTHTGEQPYKVFVNIITIITIITINSALISIVIIVTVTTIIGNINILKYFCVRL
ncbi:unnamed protein product [Anisakis simplex]|uniref:Zinc finger protein n=1 Tax=Anisakis simplex TaxID=6269 RepID=A0A158PPD4_ANISI|nr:unnamed protein product [Anisakis simplex]